MASSKNKVPPHRAAQNTQNTNRVASGLEKSEKIDIFSRSVNCQEI